jgi:hypothetical protein
MLAAVRAAALELAESEESEESGESARSVESAGGGGTVWTRAGARFAVLRGATLDLRVGSAIAAAALRTPDTNPATEGPDWIAFDPPVLDGHALDRMAAWFGAAHRRATDLVG